MDGRAPGFEQGAAEAQDVVGGLQVVGRRRAHSLAEQDGQGGGLFALGAANIVWGAEGLKETLCQP